MKYQVLWTEAAERELAEIWLAAFDREAVTQAADGLEHELAVAPGDLGESRPGQRGIAHWLPLGICFRVQEDDLLVRVLAVWECRRTQS